MNFLSFPREKCYRFCDTYFFCCAEKAGGKDFNILKTYILI
ncbi:Uncharacterized protein dnm_002460 [Desulfonema magnum]|uniref:Uncharacterized protein n=1 Tax=Desulfonema magnum TaxID=45655 RepID=A0A975GK51_9BACT|nr:Uncharacterized protein dnm_002460 [Desulfonema magnum]